MATTNMTASEKVVRDGYAIAERQEVEAFIAHFTPDGCSATRAPGRSFAGETWRSR
jgi:hypothetical protein